MACALPLTESCGVRPSEPPVRNITMDDLLGWAAQTVLERVTQARAERVRRFCAEPLLRFRVRLSV